MAELYARLIEKKKKKLIETPPNLWPEIRDILYSKGLDDDGNQLIKEDQA